MVGTVSRLWRYPVKSMLGEECRELAVEARGVAGDRLYALRDAEGKLGSGKNTRRFRPNLVVETDGDEQAWLGRVLRVGDVRLRVDSPTERCRMSTLPQSGLPNDPKILRCEAQEAGLNFGVYAQVLTPGTVGVGGRVDLEDE